MTLYALWAFQSVNGLIEHGEIGPETVAALRSPRHFEARHPELAPRWIEIDLDRSVLGFFDGGRLQLVSHISSGSGRAFCENDICGDAITPIGLFRIILTVEGWDYGPLGPMYNSLYFLPGFAIHGADSVPDYGASHGCVRIPVHVARYLFGVTRVGDAVAINGSGERPGQPPAQGSCT